jgi:hypothetical protein
MTKSDRIIAEFESELKAGKNPSLKKFVKRYKDMDKDTLYGLIVLRALYDYKEEMKLPPGFKEQQRKFVQDLIKRNPRR